MIEEERPPHNESDGDSFGADQPGRARGPRNGRPEGSARRSSLRDGSARDPRDRRSAGISARPALPGRPGAPHLPHPSEAQALLETHPLAVRSGTDGIVFAACTPGCPFRTRSCPGAGSDRTPRSESCRRSARHSSTCPRSPPSSVSRAPRKSERRKPRSRLEDRRHALGRRHVDVPDPRDRLRGDGDEPALHPEGCAVVCVRRLCRATSASTTAALAATLRQSHCDAIGM